MGYCTFVKVSCNALLPFNLERTVGPFSIERTPVLRIVPPGTDCTAMFAMIPPPFPVSGFCKKKSIVGHPILRHFTHLGGCHRVGHVRISTKASEFDFLDPKKRLLLNSFFWLSTRNKRARSYEFTTLVCGETYNVQFIYYRKVVFGSLVWCAVALYNVQ